MSGEFLIDTNAIIKLLSRDPSLRWRMGHDFRSFLSIVSVGELYAGAHQSERSAFNLSEVQRICAEIPVLGSDVETAKEYGRVQAMLRKKGRPIPQNDIWIAATAIRYSMTLITLDRHFNWIDGLPVEVW
jgi:tRNA(fMet)-specific endonuclease VapC